MLSLQIGLLVVEPSVVVDTIYAARDGLDPADVTHTKSSPKTA